MIDFIGMALLVACLIMWAKYRLDQRVTKPSNCIHEWDYRYVEWQRRQLWNRVCVLCKYQEPCDPPTDDEKVALRIRVKD